MLAWLEVELILFWLRTQLGEYMVMRLTARPRLSECSRRDTCSTPASIFSAAHLSARAPSVSFTWNAADEHVKTQGICSACHG